MWMDESMARYCVYMEEYIVVVAGHVSGLIQRWMSGRWRRDG